ncbi:MAG TPA: PfkB family carbohydrate kinase [Roseiflexaceae bacterium]|nr:PfkB family carbohydrate kinase [Roseiflexaceae bacterium]
MIVAFGNPVYDYIKTPTVTTGTRVLSGGSTNGCLALSRLGHATTLVGRIGPDFYDRFLNDTQRYGIASVMQLCEQTGGFGLIYDQRGDRTLDVLGIAGPIEQIPGICSQAEAITIAPILQETSPALIEQIHTFSDAPLFLDPQGLMRRVGPHGRIEHFCPPELAQVAPLCRVIKANEMEAEAITGVNPRANGAKALASLKALGCEIAIVTLAEAGSLIDDGQYQLMIPAYTTEAHDPTGAGDTYMAGFIHSYLHNPHDLYTAGCYGAATASIWIEHTGPDAPVTREEVERRVAALLALPRR